MVTATQTQSPLCSFWLSQCSGGQKCERCEQAIKIAIMQKDLAARKIHFHSHYIYAFKTLKIF